MAEAEYETVSLTPEALKKMSLVDLRNLAEANDVPGPLPKGEDELREYLNKFWFADEKKESEDKKVEEQVAAIQERVQQESEHKGEPERKEESEGKEETKKPEKKEPKKPGKKEPKKPGKKEPKKPGKKEPKSKKYERTSGRDFDHGDKTNAVLRLVKEGATKDQILEGARVSSGHFHVIVHFLKKNKGVNIVLDRESGEYKVKKGEAVVREYGPYKKSEPKPKKSEPKPKKSEPKPKKSEPKPKKSEPKPKKSEPKKSEPKKSEPKKSEPKKSGPVRDAHGHFISSKK